MKKLKFTEELLNLECNQGAIADLSNKLESEIEPNTILAWSSDEETGCTEELCKQNPIPPGQVGYWTCAFGSCVFIPAP